MKSNLCHTKAFEIPAPATPLPICPRCNEAFDSVNIHPAAGVVLFSCPLCHCFLGIQAVTPTPVPRNEPKRDDWLAL
jgi:hypothetical protein